MDEEKGEIKMLVAYVTEEAESELEEIQDHLNCIVEAIQEKTDCREHILPAIYHYLTIVGSNCVGLAKNLELMHGEDGRGKFSIESRCNEAAKSTKDSLSTLVFVSNFINANKEKE